MRARRDEVWLGAGVEIHVAVARPDGAFDVAQPAQFDRQPDGSQWPQPMLRLNPTEAQALIDSLWDCGLRPSEGSGSAGALAATQRHLDDMRRLVFEGRR